MLPVFIALAVLLSAGVLALIAFLVKSIVAPRKAETIEKLIRNGKAQQAVKLARQIIAKNPRDLEAHYILGKAYLADNKPELALAEFKSVNASPSFKEKIPEKAFRQTIAGLYIRFGQQEEALKEYLLLMKLDPDNAGYCFSAGELFEQRNNHEQAIACYYKATKLNPRHAEAHAALGHLLYLTKHNAAAESEIDAALKLDPQNAKAHFCRGRILMAGHEYAKAIAAFEKAARSHELKQKSFIERGRCYMAAKNYERAASEFLSAINASDSPSSSDTLHARYFLAHCMEKNRDIDGAVVQWQEIQKHKKNFMDVNEKLALYQSATANDSMKEYLTAGKEDFFTICKSIATGFLKLVVQPNGIKETRYGCVIAAVENDEGMLNMRKMPHLAVFYRNPDLIEEGFLRNLLEAMKKQSVVKGTVFASSGFARSAIKFAENRSINLIGPERLESILDAANPFSKK